jgi:hypothetical protein
MGLVWIHGLFFIPPSNSPNNSTGSQTGGLFCGYLKITHQQKLSLQEVIFGLFLSGVHYSKREIVGLQ